MLQGLSNSGDLYKRRKHEGKNETKKTGSDSTLEDQIFCPKDGVHLSLQLSFFPLPASSIELGM
jgi:hypothetical protein